MLSVIFELSFKRPFVFLQIQFGVRQQLARGSIPGWTAAQKQPGVPRPCGGKQDHCCLRARQRVKKHPRVQRKVRGLPAHRASRGCGQRQPLGRHGQVALLNECVWIIYTIQLTTILMNLNMMPWLLWDEDGDSSMRADGSIKMRWILSDVQLRNINMSNKSSILEKLDPSKTYNSQRTRKCSVTSMRTMGTGFLADEPPAEES